MDDDELLRYSRHILLPEIGIEGQARIRDAHVLMVGAGGLGSPAALYLASAGVGTLTIADDDTVDLSNLQRQVIHTVETVGRAKVDSARENLARINPQTRVVSLRERLADRSLDAAVYAADVVLDCSDNFPTRHAINRACARLSRPLVSGAGVRFDGQVSVFDLRASDSPCYECVFPEDATPEEVRCAVTGVFAPLTGIVGTLQAAEALKVIAGIGQTLSGRLLIIDALSAQFRTVRMRRDPACRVCAGFRPATPTAG
jgi:adenylyltransferase/sulfurtransferase